MKLLKDWKRGANESHAFYETGSFGAPGSYALVFRNHGGRQWFAMVENGAGGLEVLRDKDATEALRYAKRAQGFDDARYLEECFCMLSNESEEYMMRKCELALTTGEKEF